MQEALDVTDFCAIATGEDGAYAWDGCQLPDGGVNLQFGGDPLVEALDLMLQELNVFQSKVENTLHGQGQALLKREALLSNALELARVLERIAKMVTAHLVQVQSQVFDRQLSQIIQTGLLGEHETAGHAKDVREGLDAAIGTCLEEQKG